MVLVRHQTSGTNIDVMLSSSSFDDELFGRAIKKTIAGRTIRLAAPEELIVLKALAHRPQDLEDVDTIIQCYPNLDLKRVLRWAEDFARAMEEPEVITELQKVLNRHK